jgi:hypothetical protein
VGKIASEDKIFVDKGCSSLSLLEGCFEQTVTQKLGGYDESIF